MVLMQHRELVLEALAQMVGYTSSRAHTFFYTRLLMERKGLIVKLNRRAHYMGSNRYVYTIHPNYFNIAQAMVAAAGNAAPAGNAAAAPAAGNAAPAGNAAA